MNKLIIRNSSLFSDVLRLGHQYFPLLVILKLPALSSQSILLTGFCKRMISQCSDLEIRPLSSSEQRLNSAIVGADIV